jgi:hypothetical protein
MERHVTQEKMRAGEEEVRARVTYHDKRVWPGNCEGRLGLYGIVV